MLRETYDQDWTALKANSYFQHMGEVFKCRVLRAHKADKKKDKKILSELVGGYPPSQKLFACNVNVRFECGRALAEAMVKHQQDLRDAGREFYTFTLIHEDDYTGDCDTEIDLKKIISRARRLLSRVSEDFIGCVEVQAMTNFQHGPEGQEKGLLLCPHVHGVMVPKEGFKPRKAEDELASRMPQKLVGGMKPVKFKRLGLEGKDITHWMHYMSKPPLELKRLYKSNGELMPEDDVIEGEGGSAPKEEIRSEDWKSKRHRRLLLRLAEIQSYFTMNNLLFASGVFTGLRRRVLKAVRVKLDVYSRLPSTADTAMLRKKDFQSKRIRKVFRRERPDGRRKECRPPTICVS